MRDGPGRAVGVRTPPEEPLTQMSPPRGSADIPNAANHTGHAWGLMQWINPVCRDPLGR